MYEEERRFSWTNLFIKLIIVIIFILFTVWLLSLSTKSITRGMSNSLDVLTDNIFSQNVEKMKDVGKSYFTTERLPQKIGEVKTLSLAKMYDENLILEIKDKNGNVCSAKNSYVSVEKLENEYQMKVYLECGEESDYIKVIMGCYNYCDKDICEKKETPVVPGVPVEYEYSRTTGGSWGPYGNWSEWSKTSVTKTNYRDVETKVVREDYSYDKQVVEDVYKGEATCPVLDGYSNTGNSNGVCSYVKTITDVKGAANCPLKSGDYDLVSQRGFTCNYSKSVYGTTNPNTCPSKSGDYDLVSQNGFTCNYKKSTYATTDPNACPSKSGDYDFVSQSGFTCNYKRTTTETIPAQQHGGDAIVGDVCSSVVVGYDTVRPCSTCGVQMVPIYGTSCTTGITGYTPVSYSCPNGYTRSGSNCTGTKVETKTTTVGCPSGYTKQNNTCVATTATVSTKTTTVGCPDGYEKRGDSCVKDITYTASKNVVCPAGQKLKGTKCYKEQKTTQTVTESRNVTYYRYRLREYVGGTTDYQWSTSNNDKSLISAGYKLTGKTRKIGGK